MEGDAGLRSPTVFGVQLTVDRARSTDVGWPVTHSSHWSAGALLKFFGLQHQGQPCKPGRRDCFISVAPYISAKLALGGTLLYGLTP